MQTHENEFPITGREGGPIDLKTAAEWTKNYRQRNPNETISHFFGYQIVDKIRGQEGCLGLRIYYANSERLGIFQRIILDICNFLEKIAAIESVKHLIIVGVNKDGTDQLPTPIIKPANEKQPIAALSFAANSENTAADMSKPCPGTSGCPENDLTGQTN